MFLKKDFCTHSLRYKRNTYIADDMGYPYWWLFSPCNIYIYSFASWIDTATAESSAVPPGGYWLKSERITMGDGTSNSLQIRWPAALWTIPRRNEQQGGAHFLELNFKQFFNLKDLKIVFSKHVKIPQVLKQHIKNKTNKFLKLSQLIKHED